MKSDIFNKELSYIKNDEYRKNARTYLELLPDYFYTVEASSTGKYHPSFALGDKGLVRHVKVAVRIGKELTSSKTIGNVFTDNEKDLILIALLLHDGLKEGIVKEKYTRFDHPILMANYIIENYKEFNLTKEDSTFIAEVIKTHMGPWIEDYSGNKVLEPPKTKYQNFVHMCDYLASRKFLLVPFDGNDLKD